jgi:cell wall-active antibiotic response 4TMS protein YvqF
MLLRARMALPEAATRARSRRLIGLPELSGGMGKDDMNYHRGLLFWGLALITGGAVALAAQQGYIDRDALAGAWRLWPLILVAIGLSILVSRTPYAIVGTIVAALVVGSAGGALIAVGPGVAACGGAEPSTLTTEQGAFGDSAQVTLDFNCGTLAVSTTDGDEWSVASGRQGGDPARITSDSGRLHVESSDHDGWWNGGRQHWIVGLPTSTSYRLDITPNAADATIDLGGGRFTAVSLQPNAGSVRLDLSDAQVDDLDLSLNAGSVAVLIGEGLSMNASMSVNAGSIELCTEGDVALSVTTSANITFSHNLDESNLQHVGDTWSTPGYADASDQVRIDLEGNAASFTLNPEGGCS